MAIPHHLYPIEALCSLKKGPFLGMDWGRKRVGLAISDPDNTVAMPLSVVQAGGMLRTTLNALWSTRNIQALIIGWPLHANGQTGALCTPILRLAHRLHHDHGWPIALWDERFTTRSAHAFMLESKKVIDDHAAAVILQGALLRWKKIKEANL